MMRMLYSEDSLRMVQPNVARIIRMTPKRFQREGIFLHTRGCGFYGI